MAYGVLYLHGFASDPNGSKATHFRRVFAERGVPFVAPDLNAGDFPRITLSSMQTVARRALGELSDRECVIVGSSMGGYAAAHLAAELEATLTPPRALILFAPAFHLARLWKGRLSADRRERWRQQDRLDLGTQHPAGHPAFVRYAIVEDAERWDARPLVLRVPTLILHGERDESVPIRSSRDFARTRPNVRLVTVAGDHGMNGRIDVLEREVLAFVEEHTR